MDDPISAPLPEGLLTEIGALVVTASAVDHQVGFQILRMISPINFVAHHAWPVVAGMDFKVKLGLVRTLAAIYPKAARDYIVECCDQMQTVYTRRNQVAHMMIIGVLPKGKVELTSMKGDATTGEPAPPLIIDVEMVRGWGRSLFTWSNELEQTLSDLGFPIDGATEDDIGARPPEDEREATRPKSLAPRPTRKKPRPPVPAEQD
jgi:hypothetical protein